MQDSIKSIREELNGKVQEKQGYGNVPQTTVNSVLSEARYTVLGKSAMPGAQEERLIVDGENMVTKVLIRANKFFDGAWKGYRSLAEASTIKMFKDYKPIE
jgi:hypothetical protein